MIKIIEKLNKIIKPKKKIVFITVFVIGVLLFLIAGNSYENKTPVMKEEASDTIWTCSMHPQVRLPKPGKCPICFMDLIPLVEDQATGPNEMQNLKLTKEAVELARINTVDVSFQNVEREINLYGKAMIDETTMGKVSSRFKGRIEKLYINFTGIPIKKGDHLYKIYSPELFAAQDAYVNSYINYKKSLEAKQQNYIGLEENALNASMDRLLFLGITKEQINNLQNTLKPQDTITIFSEYSGIVLDKRISEGDYVQSGTVAFSIADLSKLWIVFDVYESDIQWVRYGQKLDIFLDAFPGQTFSGRLAYIDPVLDEKTRTIKARVSFDNKNGLIKPGMLAKAVLKTRLTSNLEIVDKDLSGKWISPMHPEIIKSKPGNCDICGMPLVKAEDFGYVAESSGKDKKLVIPVTAPLITGKRALVYVEKLSDDGEYIYENREIVLGPKTGAFYIVESGLSPGERVVVEGNFKLDAAMQIQAKSSMMSSDPEAKNEGSETDVFLDSYLETKDEFDFEIPKGKLEKEQSLRISEVFDLFAKINQSFLNNDFNQSRKIVTKLLAYTEKEIINFFHEDDIRHLNHALLHIKEAGNIEELKAYFVQSNLFIKQFIEQKDIKDLQNDFYVFSSIKSGKEIYWISNYDNSVNPFWNDSSDTKLLLTIKGGLI